MDKKLLLVEKIKNTLESMGCTEIIFSDTDDSIITVLFNCKELTNFKTNLDEWTYSGIYLDPNQLRQYRIDFRKI